MLSRLVMAFLSRNKCLLISWLQSPSAVILEPKKIKSVTVSIVSPSICCEVMGQHAMILVFWMLSFKQAFSLSFFTFIKRLFSSYSLSAIGWCHLDISIIWIFPSNLDSRLCLVQPGILHMYFACKLNKQGDNIQPWCTPFPIWSQSAFPCLVLTVAFWPAYRFLRRQVRQSDIPIFLRIYSLLWYTQSTALV